MRLVCPPPLKLIYFQVFYFSAGATRITFCCAAWVVSVADLKPKVSSGAVQKSNHEKLDSSEDVHAALDALAAENRSLRQEEKLNSSKNPKQEQEVTVSSVIPSKKCLVTAGTVVRFNLITSMATL